jgi:hypothetical protein
MSEDELLFDLSLFSASPTDDRHFAVHRQELHDEPVRPLRQYSRSSRGTFADKPLPPLPQKRMCPGVSVPRNWDVDSPCILARLKRTVTPPTITRDNNTLQQRRQPALIPQLTLSVPQSHPEQGNTASAMVWMPDEQMWLIENEVGQETLPDLTEYPSPLAESSPRVSATGRSQSLPNSTVPPPFALTPPLTPLTPIQTQLQSLYRPPEDERMSPMFQEAMNSVPMMDLTALDSPRLDFTPSQDLRPQRAQTTYGSSVRNLSPRASDGWQGSSRSVSMASQDSYARSNTTGSRSYYSARESFVEDLTQPAESARRWQGLARRLARPSSAD